MHPNIEKRETGPSHLDRTGDGWFFNDDGYTAALARHAEAFTAVDMYDVLSEMDHAALLKLVQAGDAQAIGAAVIAGYRAMLARLADVATEEA